MSNVTYEQAVRSREKANRMRKRNFRVLECSIRGYKPCSPLIAKVTVFGKTFTIEEWYQKSKDINGAFGRETSPVKKIAAAGRRTFPQKQNRFRRVRNKHIIVALFFLLPPVYHEPFTENSTVQ